MSSEYVNAFPVNAPVTGLGHVGEDGILLDGLDGIGVCPHRGSRSDAKKPILWVDGPQVTWKVLNQGMEESTNLARLISAPNSQVFLFFPSSPESLSLVSCQHY